MGVTRNISNSGVSILASECPAAGALIQMTIALPMRSGADFRLELHGEGVALRGECGERFPSGSKLFEFAASVQFYPEKASLISKSIADIAVGKDIYGMGRVVLDLLPKLVNEDTQILPLLAIFRSPDR
jgi:hypothetical protein